MYKELCSFQPRINHLQPDTNQTQAGHQPDTRGRKRGGEICISHRNTSALSASARSGAPISASGHSAYRFSTACSRLLVIVNAGILLALALT